MQAPLRWLAWQPRDGRVATFEMRDTVYRLSKVGPKMSLRPWWHP